MLQRCSIIPSKRAVIALQVDELWNEASIDYVRADSVHEAIDMLSCILRGLSKRTINAPMGETRPILGAHGDATGGLQCLEQHSAIMRMIRQLTS